MNISKQWLSISLITGLIVGMIIAVPVLAQGHGGMMGGFDYNNIMDDFARPDVSAESVKIAQAYLDTYVPGNLQVDDNEAKARLTRVAQKLTTA